MLTGEELPPCELWPGTGASTGAPGAPAVTPAQTPTWAARPSLRFPPHLYIASSQVENVNVRDFLLANKDQIKFYNNIHSYSQLILLPWGWGYDLPDNIDDLTRVTRPLPCSSPSPTLAPPQMANLGHDALKAVHGKEYEVIGLFALTPG